MANDFIDLLLGNRLEDRVRRLERRGSGGGSGRALTLDDLEELRERDAAQGAQIAVLRALVGALANTLRDSLAAPGTIDASVLDARLDAAIEEALHPPEPEPVPADPARRLVTCIRCRTEVPASMTTWTVNGPACDRCPVTR